MLSDPRPDRPLAPILVLALALGGIPLVLAACDTGADPTQVVAKIVVLGGDNQSAYPYSRLAQPLHVQLLDGQSNAVPGYMVRFYVPKGRGWAEQEYADTNGNGEIRMNYTIGPLPVMNEIVVTAGNQSLVMHAQGIQKAALVPVEMVHGFILPEGLAFDNEGGLYLGTQTLGQIYRITPNWKYKQLAMGLGQMLGLAVGPFGDIYACDGNRNVVLKVNPMDGSAQDFATWFDFGGLAMPNGIAVHPDGDVFFSEGEGTRILRANPEGVVSEFLGGLNRPNGIAFGPGAKTLYVNELGANRVIIVDVHEGTKAGDVRVLAENIEMPDGIALDEDGDVFVTSTVMRTLHNRVVLITVDGAILELLPAPLPKVYANIAFGRAGFDDNTLYMVSFNGTVDAVYIGVPGLFVGGPPS